MNSLADRVFKSVFLMFRWLAGGEIHEVDTGRSAASLLPDHALHRLRAIHEAEAMRYGFRYRGAIVIGFGLGFLAVLLALLPLAGVWSDSFLDQWGFVFTSLEMLCIVLILLQHFYGRHPANDSAFSSRILHKCGFRKINQGWRNRWSCERLLAEQYRYAELLLAFPGGALPIDGKVLDAGEEVSDFRRWYAEAAAILQPVQADHQAQLQGYSRNFQIVLDSQIAYHLVNAERCHAISHRLHGLADMCFWATLLFCAAHFKFHHPALSVLCALLPALAATCHGIMAAGEFGKIAAHSEEMHAALLRLKHKLGGALPDRESVQYFYALVIDEASGWHFTLRDKDLGKA